MFFLDAFHWNAELFGVFWRLYPNCRVWKLLNGAGFYCLTLTHWAESWGDWHFFLLPLPWQIQKGPRVKSIGPRLAVGHGCLSVYPDFHLYSLHHASIKHSDTHDRQIASWVASGKRSMRNASVSATVSCDGSHILLIDASAGETLSNLRTLWLPYYVISWKHPCFIS